MEKLERGASDVVTDKSSNLTLVRWKDNKVVTVVSTFEKCPSGKLIVMSKLKMAGLRLNSLKVFSYIIKVREELIASIKTSALT